MRTYSTTIVPHSQTLVKSQTCDFCGTHYNKGFAQPITRFSITPGYGSEYDDDQYNFDVCDSCLGKLLEAKSVQLVTTADALMYRENCR